MVGVQWTEVYEDGEFFFFFPRLSQTDRQSATVKLMRGRMRRRRRKRGMAGD